MRVIFAPLALALLMNGCALLAAPAVEEAGSLAGVAVPGASGALGTESTVAVNQSSIKANDIQANYTQQEIKNLERASANAKRERAATEGILQSMAKANNDPEIADLAIWVGRGGDPQYALNSAIARDNDDEARAEIVRILENMSEENDDSRLYELARWVRAGGDEKFALNYALSHDAKSAVAPGHPASVKRPAPAQTSATNAAVPAAGIAANQGVFTAAPGSQRQGEPASNAPPYAGGK